MAKERSPEAEKRLYNRMFICMKCGARMRADLLDVRAGKVKCRKCRRKQLRPVHKTKK